jgi:hypothetical protein
VWHFYEKPLLVNSLPMGNYVLIFGTAQAEDMAPLRSDPSAVLGPKSK